MWTDIRLLCGGRCRRWPSLMLSTVLCSSLIPYLYLYYNAIGGIQIPTLLQNVQENQTAVGNSTLGSDFLDLRNGSNFQFELPLSRSTIASQSIKAIQTINQPISSPWKKRVQELTKNRTKPLLALFTTWIDNDDKKLVHNLTTVNWLSLRPFVLPIIFTNETALAKACEIAGWVTLPLRVTAADGVPVLKYMYIDTMKKYESNLYAFANADILFTDTLVDTLVEILKDTSVSHKPTLIIGRRTNVDNVTMEEGSSWNELTMVAKKRGTLFRTDAEDYFVTSPSYPWHEIPEIVVGRRAYDNWLVLNARKQKYRVIDASKTILAVHQTTNAGNHENAKKETNEYNHNLLVSLYKNSLTQINGLDEE
ncbi:hypothetical protein CHS0354_001706 [Potamilus streckersoni]|uniref:Uncharacterized protein n=1 Tax=Potamilus streckersoni TaxID=2493646 RepID=A0AAE0RZV0_9BIVA|nr:hypothetical protein CHS0354_001706 [Potamilus streckersoni]